MPDALIMADEQNDVEEAMLDAMRERLKLPEKPLTNEETRRIRAMLDEYEKAAWLKKKILTFTPWLIAVITAAGSLWQWLSTRK